MLCDTSSRGSGLHSRKSSKEAQRASRDGGQRYEACHPRVAAPGERSCCALASTRRHLRQEARAFPPALRTAAGGSRTGRQSSPADGRTREDVSKGAPSVRGAFFHSSSPPRTGSTSLRFSGTLLEICRRGNGRVEQGGGWTRAAGRTGQLQASLARSWRSAAGWQTAELVGWHMAYTAAQPRGSDQSNCGNGGRPLMHRRPCNLCNCSECRSLTSRSM